MSAGEPNLELYRQARTLTDDLVKQTSRFPEPANALANQLKRSAWAICANLGDSAESTRWEEMKHYLQLARHAATDLLPLLERCDRKSLFEDPVSRELQSRTGLLIEEIAEKISKLRLEI
jgi:four helix bundle protein